MKFQLWEFARVVKGLPLGGNVAIRVGSNPTALNFFLIFFFGSMVI